MELKVTENPIYALDVYVGNAPSYIASEIEPILVGEFTDNHERWENGPTSYARWLLHQVYLIKWEGKLHLIESVLSAGDYTVDTMNHWQLINELPDCLEITNA